MTTSDMVRELCEKQNIVLRSFAGVSDRLPRILIKS